MPPPVLSLPNKIAIIPLLRKFNIKKFITDSKHKIALFEKII